MIYVNWLGYCAPVAVAIRNSLSLGAFQSGLRRRAIKATLLLCLITVAASAQTATATTIGSSVEAGTLGHTVKFTATVSTASATGTVTFFDGVNILGIEPLSNGQATLTTSLLTAGTHSIAAFYGGDKSDTASVSQPLPIVVRSLPGFGFHPVQNPVASVSSNTLLVADFNNDGIPDLAVTDSTILGMIGASLGDLTVLLGNGDGTFRTTAHFSDTSSQSAVTGDFNGDGVTDIVTFSNVYLGNGDGTFQNPIPLTIGSGDDHLTSLAVGDFNGDGRADLAWVADIQGQSTGVVGILLGNGDGTFQPSIETSVAYGGVIAVGDFNHDGRADLAVTNGSSGASSTVTVLIGKGDGTFQTPVPYTLSALPGKLVVADFNGDGRDDLAVGGNVPGTQTGIVSILLSNPDGTFQSPVNYPLPGFADLNVGDFNGDGRVDVVVEYGAAASPAGANAYVMLGNGDGTLQNPVIQASGLVSGLVVSDFNGDGRTDLAGTFVSGNNIGLEALLGVAAPPGPVAITSVLNAASFQPAIETGSWAMIQGTNLANSTRLWQTFDFIGSNLPTVVDGVSVSIDGNPAFVEYISPTQINVLAPADSTTGSVNVVVTNNGQSSAPATAQLQTVAPAFFMSPSYTVYASVIPGYTPVTAVAAAMPGDLVVLWCTGFGPTNPPTPAGRIVAGAPATTTLPVVTVGGMQVPVISSVMTTGTVGLYQITIRLPANVPTGTPAVQASIGGASTQSGVTLFVGAQ
jgi:uncharacterized protein (TIGR03437 family)